jgi:hypothetical protein
MASLKILYGALNRGVSVMGVIFKVYGDLKENKKKCIYYVIKDKVISCGIRKRFEAPLIGYGQGVDILMLIVTSNSSKSPS